MSLIHQPSLFMAVIAILWRIWKSRNWLVFEGKPFGFSTPMCQIHQQYEEWMRLTVDRAPRVVASVSQHLPHPLGPCGLFGVVCRWDGATREGSHSAGGMVVLDSDDRVLMAKGVQFYSIDDPLVVEVLALSGGSAMVSCSWVF
ncbi:unnamed protein product [Linum trigynum]|uniref:Uncharacterized protein n=1 Tax=Linum trigynum TaxID=586398 RepID=A0AAV2GGL8_9ROSI